MSLWSQPGASALLCWLGSGAWRARGCATGRTQNQQDKSDRVSCWSCPASLPRFVTPLHSSPALFVLFLKCFSHPWEKLPKFPAASTAPLLYTGTRSPEHCCSTAVLLVPEAVCDREPLCLSLWALSCPRHLTFHGHTGVPVPCTLLPFLGASQACAVLSTCWKGSEGKTTILQPFSEPVVH